LAGARRKRNRVKSQRPEPKRLCQPAGFDPHEFRGLTQRAAVVVVFDMPWPVMRS
jgi:hypothetical protein